MSGKKKKQPSKRASDGGKLANSRRPESTAALPVEPSITAVLNSGKLRELYATMLQCRMLIERRGSLSTALKDRLIDEAGSKREAVMVGAVTHVLPCDSIVVAQWGFLARFIRRTPLASILAHLLAKEASAAERGAAEQSSHGSPAQRSMIKGMTLAHNAIGSPAVVLVFPGEDTAALAFHYDALARAARHKLPLACVIEAGPSFEWTAERQSAQSGSASHFPEIAVDGCDVVAMFRVAQEAVRRARSGHGPSLIQCVMPGQSSQSRTAHKALEPRRDPLELMENYLRRKDLWSDAWQRNVMDAFGKELDAAIVAVKHAAGLPVHFDGVYSAELTDASSSAESPAEKIELPNS
jgi:TPP-dependent pyruvate/acetoin dehydrogenase alpha subunit